MIVQHLALSRESGATLPIGMRWFGGQSSLESYRGPRRSSSQGIHGRGLCHSGRLLFSQGLLLKMKRIF